MMKELFKKRLFNQKNLTIFGIVLLSVFGNTFVYADDGGGIGMVIFGPIFLLTLIPIVVIETIVFSHLAKVDWKKIIGDVLIANIISTLIGIWLFDYMFYNEINDIFWRMSQTGEDILALLLIILIFIFCFLSSILIEYFYFRLKPWGIKTTFFEIFIMHVFSYLYLLLWPLTFRIGGLFFNQYFHYDKLVPYLFIGLSILFPVIIHYLFVLFRKK